MYALDSAAQSVPYVGRADVQQLHRGGDPAELADHEAVFAISYMTRANAATRGRNC